MIGFHCKHDDRFYNRRRLAVLSLAYAVIWGFIILAVDLVTGFETSKVIAYLGFVATVCGLPTWQYLRAAAKDDPRGKDD